MKKIQFKGLILILFVLPLFILSSCTYDKNECKYEKFLAISTNDYSSFSAADIKIIVEALERMDVLIIRGNAVCNQKKASELNISEDLYDLIMRMISNYGKFIETKAMGPGSDCVAYALSHLTGFNYSYDYIEAYIDANYGGDGVPAEDMDLMMLDLFGTSLDFVDMTSTSLDTVEFGINVSVGYFQVDTFYHMVNIYRVQDDFVFYQDYQNNMFNCAPLSAFVQFYKVL